MHQALKVCQPFKRSIVDDVVASVVTSCCVRCSLLLLLLLSSSTSLPMSALQTANELMVVLSVLIV